DSCPTTPADSSPIWLLLHALATRRSSDLLGERNRDAGPQVTVHVEGDPVPLPTALEVALLRIAQSSLANALRHAEAQRVGITLRSEEHTSELQSRLTLVCRPLLETPMSI